MADVAVVVTIALARAVLCLDCERVFEIGSHACPGCGGRVWYPLERFFTGGAERKLVRLHDVVHEAGNGLTPARVRAERLSDGLKEYVALGMARNALYITHCQAHADRIVEAIDETMRRLRALGGATQGDTTA
jgi:hypothetical protein